MEPSANDEIEALVEVARAMVPERRRRFLQAACGTDAELRAEVESRLRDNRDRRTQNSETGADSLSEPPHRSPDSAETLAFDLVSAGIDPTTEPTLEARSVQPPGVPIDVDAEQRRLNLRDRLYLFRQACRLVHSLHQQGQIDGQLRPDRLLVGDDGVCRLAPRSSTQPVESRRDAMELSQRENHSREGWEGKSVDPLGFCSPEQALGQTPTTLSDIYALGVILYQLLVGRRPFPNFEVEEREWVKVICEQLPERPSLAVVRGPRPGAVPPEATSEAIARSRRTTPRRLSRELAGDLELIILKALRKEPEERYCSAAEFAEDIENYQSGRPVRARRGSRTYVAAKFLTRQPALALVTLGLGLALVCWLIAERANLASERLRRERLDRAFQAAHTMVNQLADGIRQNHQLEAPNVFDVRQRLLGSAVQYYQDILDHQGGADPQGREWDLDARLRAARLCRAVSPPAEAAWRYRDAIRQMESFLVEQPTAAQVREELVRGLNELGEILLGMNEAGEETSRVLTRALSLLDPQGIGKPSSSARRRELARTYTHLAELARQQGDFPQARSSIERAIQMAAPLVDRETAYGADLELLAGAHSARGRILLEQQESLDLVCAAIREGIRMRERLVHDDPNWTEQAYQLAVELFDFATFLKLTGDLAAAAEPGHRAVELFESLDRRFPNATPYQRGLYLSYDFVSRLQHQQGQITPALTSQNQARSVLERLVASDPKEPIYRIDLSRSHNFIGRLLQKEGRFAEALRSFQRAIDQLESLPERTANDDYQLAVNLAACVTLIGSRGTVSSPDDEASLSPTDRLYRQVYAQRAVTALRRAARRGLHDAEKIGADPDLKILQNDDEFRKLLDDLNQQDVEAREGSS
jgi:tetratricopeptide (TPR) repeat protein